MNVNLPWNLIPQQGKQFHIPGIDNVPDLVGDIIDPQLVIFFHGNQFMVVPDLLAAFQQAYPQYERIYVETLPPGILIMQVEQGALVVGNLRISLQPDILTASENRIEQLAAEKDWFNRQVVYARNRLGIMIHQNNPAYVTKLTDLGRDDVRVSMPDPQTEGIGQLILASYEKAGGPELVDKIMKDKVNTGMTFLTQIHHRQTPMRILNDESDAGLVWRTEALFQQSIHNPIQLVEIPEAYNSTGNYMAARLENAPHPQAAADFLDFLTSSSGQMVYRQHGFLPPP